MECRIERDPQTKEVIRVESPNGYPSALFNEAVAYSGGNKERALDLWAVAYTPEFKQEFGNWEGSLMKSTSKGSSIQTSLDKVKLNYNSEGKPLAPNGNVSNLSIYQSKLVRTPEFKRWFGDWENNPENASKVVDENGEPLVVYHGSVTPNIVDFDRSKSERVSSGLKEFGIHFSSNKKVAEIYKGQKRKDGTESTGKIYEVFLNLRNVEEFNAEFDNNIEAWNRLTVDAGYDIKSGRPAIEVFAGQNNAAIARKGKGIVKDGLIARDILAYNVFFTRMENGKQVRYQPLQFTEADKQSKQYQDAIKEYGGDEYLVFDNKTNLIKPVDSFIFEAPKSNNVEPPLSAVINFILKDKYKGQKLSNKEYFEFSNNLTGLSVSSLSDLYKKVRDAFIKNGVFTINTASLRESGLYTELEIQNIVGSTEAYKTIKKNVEKLMGAYLNNSVDKNFKQALNQEKVDTVMLIQDTSSVVGIGKFRYLNPLDVEADLNKSLAGVTNREAFDARMAEIPYPPIVERYNSDNAFAEHVYLTYSQRVPMKRFKDSNGSLTETSTNVLEVDRIYETLVKGDTHQSIINNLDFLTGIDQESWQESADEIETIVDTLINDTAEFGLDISDIKNIIDFVSKPKFDTFAAQLDLLVSNLLLGTLTRNQIESYVAAKNALIDVSDDSQYKYVKNDTRAKALMSLNTIQNEADLFNNYSLLHVKDDIYQKINRTANFESLLEVVYLQVLNDPSILPTEAYYPSAFNAEGKFSISKLKDERYRTQVKQDITNFLNQKAKMMDSYGHSLDTLREIAAYKHFFKHPSPETLNKFDEVNRMSDFSGNFSYLTTDFIADFNKYIVKEKIGNTDAYNQVLKYFEFTPNGIKLSVSPEYIRNNANILVDNKILNDLRQYSYLSRDNNLHKLFSVERTEESDQSERLFYINNPKALNLFKSDYYIQDNVLVTENGTDKFLKIKDQFGDDVLYEQVSDFAGKFLYRELPSRTDFEYNVVPKITLEPVSKEVIQSITNQMNSNIELETPIASDAEIRSLRDEFDCE